jgi:uncharacterized protein
MIIDSLRKKLIESQKSQKELETATLRLLISELKNKEISLRAEGKDLTNEDLLKVLKKQIKNRNETIPMYEKAGRIDTATTERKEVEYLESLIKEMFPDELSN